MAMNWLTLPHVRAIAAIGQKAVGGAPPRQRETSPRATGLVVRRRAANKVPVLAIGGMLTGVLVTACSPVASLAPGSASAATVVPVPAVPVQRSTILQSVTVSGDVRAKDQVTVLPKVAGRVAAVMVDVGTAVKAGDVLAQLEQDAPALQAQQAQANLAAAQAKLAQVQASGRPDDVAQGQVALAQQQARLAAMRAGGRQEDVAAADAAVQAQQA